jgi:hypothetical protein
VEIAGAKVRCWKIREQRALSKGLRSWTRCYAPGIGLVSEEVRDEVDGTVTQRSSILETYEKESGKK